MIFSNLKSFFPSQWPLKHVMIAHPKLAICAFRNYKTFPLYYSLIMPGLSIHPKIEGSRGMLRIMYPRYPLQIYGSFPIHLSEKSSDPENIPSGPADFFGIIPLREEEVFLALEME